MQIDGHALVRLNLCDLPLDSFLSFFDTTCLEQCTCELEFVAKNIVKLHYVGQGYFCASWVERESDVVANVMTFIIIDYNLIAGLSFLAWK